MTLGLQFVYDVLLLLQFKLLSEDDTVRLIDISYPLHLVHTLTNIIHIITNRCLLFQQISVDLFFEAVEVGQFKFLHLLHSQLNDVLSVHELLYHPCVIVSYRNPSIPFKSNLEFFLHVV